MNRICEHFQDSLVFLERSGNLENLESKDLLDVMVCVELRDLKVLREKLVLKDNVDLQAILDAMETVVLTETTDRLGHLEILECPERKELKVFSDLLERKSYQFEQQQSQL